MWEFLFIVSWGGVVAAWWWFMYHHGERGNQIVEILFFNTPYKRANEPGALQKTTSWLQLENAFFDAFGDELGFCRAHFKVLKEYIPNRSAAEYDAIMETLVAIAKQHSLISPFDTYVAARYPAAEVRVRWNAFYSAFITDLAKMLPPPQKEVDLPFLTISRPSTLIPPLVFSLTFDRALSELRLARAVPAIGTRLPLENLAAFKDETHIEETKRFEHMWIVGPPGTGKSTLLSRLIFLDLFRVMEGKCSVIVMESNRDLVKSLEQSAIFAPGGALHGKLVSIDVEDVEYPVALNLFDMGGDTANLSPRDREALHNSTVSMLDYIFRALLGADLTSRQSTLFNFTITLLLTIPNATLDTMIDLMQPKGLAKYARYLDGMDSDTKLFFSTKFEAKEFEQTKSQVVDRLFAVKRIRAISRMFSAPKTKLNLYEEMGKGRVILINAAKSLLQEDGVELFTRFFLASILLAAEKRQMLDKADRLPTFVYIDEAQDTIRRDEKLPIILDQARKFNVGMVLAHQRLDQMTPPVLNALYSSTAIKMAAKLSDANASALARNMGTTPEFIATQDPFHFALSVRGVVDSAVSYKVVSIEGALPKMTDSQAQEVREDMRRRYSYTPGEVTPPKSEPEKGEDMKW
jgi:hypothetical protein